MIRCPRCKARCTDADLMPAYTEVRRRPVVITDDGQIIPERMADSQGISGRTAWIPTRKPDVESVCQACIGELREGA